ncbi:MAG: DUF6851 domain-containing protein [Bacteroidota bacterium]
MQLFARILFFSLSLSLITPSVFGQHSVARQWNEVLLEAIRMDFARPTVHARNLFHTSIGLYDAWAILDEEAQPYLLGKVVDGCNCPFTLPETPTDLQAAQEMAMSYAAFRLVNHRFKNSPGQQSSLGNFRSLMYNLGYSPEFTSQDYSQGNFAAVGNYLADCLIRYGLHDGSNEQHDYASLFYEPLNEPLRPNARGNPRIQDFDRWQPLEFDIFIDQSGQQIGEGVPEFLGPEWGKVVPFALTENELTIKERDGHQWWVYHDPGPPPYWQENGGGLSDPYAWGFAMVAVWSAHLDETDSVMWDISPGAIGNQSNFPQEFEDYPSFYDFLEGGDPSQGHDVNPFTQQPYVPQMVPRGDYARVLAEFWADGPDSETPPGHWFTILNTVSDDPNCEKKYAGEGERVSDLEWDVKAYFTLGGAMHDAAVTAWGVKGFYDYLRPISAIRAMADLGQRSDPQQPSYHPGGIPLVPGYIEVVAANDELAAFDPEAVGKIKLKAWRGPWYIFDPQTTTAGVGWILAENWWPYQRPSFVTPPFAGYISGHSTYSRAAAEVLTELTGDPFFPGGMGEFIAPKNEFLVFEDGPSQDVVLQWATYRDASDQTSLSRIWGGIHPPADDIPGRLMGEQIGQAAFALARKYFNGQVDVPVPPMTARAFPNPVESGQQIGVQIPFEAASVEVTFADLSGRVLSQETRALYLGNRFLSLSTTGLSPGVYVLRVQGADQKAGMKIVVY